MKLICNLESFILKIQKTWRLLFIKNKFKKYYCYIIQTFSYPKFGIETKHKFFTRKYQSINIGNQNAPIFIQKGFKFNYLLNIQETWKHPKFGIGNIIIQVKFSHKNRSTNNLIYIGNSYLCAFFIQIGSIAIWCFQHWHEAFLLFIKNIFLEASTFDFYKLYIGIRVFRIYSKFWFYNLLKR